MQYLTTLLLTAIFGIPLGIFSYQFYRKKLLDLATDEASEIIGDVREQIELKEIEQRDRTQEIEMQFWTKVEPEMLKIESRIEELEELAQEKKKKNDLAFQASQAKVEEYKQAIREFEKITQNQESKYQKVRQSLHDRMNVFQEKLMTKLQMNKEQLVGEMSRRLITEHEEYLKKQIEIFEEDLREHAEMKAKRIMALAIDRFARAYCPERGIGAVEFPDARSRGFLCDPQGKNIATIQELTGCDIIVEDDMNMIGVAGFDPVRRELTRRLLDRLMRDKKPIDPGLINKTFDRVRRELFIQIKNDGDTFAKELGIRDLHPEIKQMMGSLRYRYSFTQNQYFHCAEVGWLAGLLAAEVGVEIAWARRSGALHDIGKSMDHSMDGGHAMIGADFIQSRGEKPHIVHSVRAHHFDVAPEDPHDFIVIAADAISGARPGARRSTIETYNQKVSEIQEIARSFHGVTDCFVLNGGRECRVLVNSRQINDPQSLEIAKGIVNRIENECNYPGTIKVVVVRETFVNESTRKEYA